EVGPGEVGQPGEDDEGPGPVGDGFDVGGVLLDDRVVADERVADLALDGELLTGEELLADGLADPAGDGSGVGTVARGAGDTEAGEQGKDHHPCEARRGPAGRAPGGPRLCPRGRAGVDGPQDDRGAVGVVVAEGRVVVGVEVAGLALAFEVVERPQQEVALLFERGERVGVELVAALPGRCGAVGHRARSRRARSTRSRSSSLTSTGDGRHRRKTTTRAAAAPIAPATGIAQTRLAAPDD